MLSAIVNSGFSITGTWPVRTESPGRSVAQGTNALASSIVLVCRKRRKDTLQTTRRNMITILRRELRPALKNSKIVILLLLILLNQPLDQVWQFILDIKKF